MPVFQKPAFMSDNPETELAYTKGVMALQQSDFYSADEYFREAAADGHASAYYNLSLLHGGGSISPYDIDFAADCFYKAAAEGHPTAAKNLWYLEGADRGGFGIQRLTQVASEWASGGGLNHLLMMCACRFNDALCRTYNGTSEVIAYELDAASASDDRSVLAFLERTGVAKSFYSGGLNRLTEGLAGDQITTGLNDLYLAMRQSGMTDAVCRMARCTIVGYIISKSTFGAEAEPLLGLDRFFEARSPVQRCRPAIDENAGTFAVSRIRKASLESGFTVGGVLFAKVPENESELAMLSFELAGELATKLLTGHQVYWYVIEQYDRILGCSNVNHDVEEFLSLRLFEMEYSGRRSEESHLGQENPGIEFIYGDVAPDLQAQFGRENAEVIIAAVFEVYCENIKDKIDPLRLHYAMKYRDNCVMMESWNSADRWCEVIASLGGE